MSEWCTQIYNYIQQYFNHSPILYMYIVGLIYLCFRGRRIRLLLVYPSVLLMLIILNPWLYGYVWTRLIQYAFWRMIWMIPVIPVIGVSIVELASMVKMEWLKCVITLCFVVLIITSGDNIYSQNGVYVKAENAYKLPQECIEIANKILEYDSNPTVLAPSSLYCYLRQYNGSIKQVYGRDADGYVNSIEDAQIYELIEMMRNPKEDIAKFVQLAREREVDIIILPVDNTGEILDNYGYGNICTMHGYKIYQRQE